MPANLDFPAVTTIHITIPPVLDRIIAAVTEPASNPGHHLFDQKAHLRRDGGHASGKVRVSDGSAPDIAWVNNCG